MKKCQAVLLIVQMTIACLPGCAGPPSRAIASPVQKVEVPATDPVELLDQLVKAHNLKREEEGLLPLTSSKRLQAAAERHANDMAEQNKMDHTGSDGSTSAERVKDAGYDYKRCGENVAWGQKSVDEVVDVWMKSPPHQKNILGSFTQMGAARATSKDGTPYWCVVFGTPMRK